MTRTAPPTEDPGATPGVVPPRAPLRLLASVRAGLLAAVLFVFGLVVGGLAVGLVAEDTVVVDAPEGGAVGGGVPGPLLPEGDTSVEFVVDGTCLRAVNAAQDTFLVVDDLGAAAAALDAARLDEIVRQLMPLQRRLESGLRACEVATVVGGSGSEPTEQPDEPTEQPAEPSPSTVPSGSPPTD